MRHLKTLKNKANEMIIGYRHDALPLKKERGGSELAIVLGLILIGLVLLGLFKHSLLGIADTALNNIKNATDTLFSDFNNKHSGT